VDVKGSVQKRQMNLTVSSPGTRKEGRIKQERKTYKPLQRPAYTEA
jgi:hypothetical protein